MDVDVDSERLQNKYVQTESHLITSKHCNDIGRLSPSEVTQAMGDYYQERNMHFLSTMQFHHNLMFILEATLVEGIVASNGAG